MSSGRTWSVREPSRLFTLLCYSVHSILSNFLAEIRRRTPVAAPVTILPKGTSIQPAERGVGSDRGGLAPLELGDLLLDLGRELGGALAGSLELGAAGGPLLAVGHLARDLGLELGNPRRLRVGLPGRGRRLACGRADALLSRRGGPRQDGEARDQKQRDCGNVSRGMGLGCHGSQPNGQMVPVTRLGARIRCLILPARCSASRPRIW